jgi:predicted house-cleaning noncanonical NTP pyrophosphatase (MazG superfamily)
MQHSKLVRDRIPEIIASRGARPITLVLDQDEYRLELQRKLQEEVAEFAQSGQVEELADILEVTYALAAVQGVSRSQLERIRSCKREERGGFEDRIFLVETLPEEP